MALLLVGINHVTANVALREKIAFPAETVAEALASARALAGVDEAVIVSTCNRTELYLELAADAETGTAGAGPQRMVLEWLAGWHRIKAIELEGCSYCLAGEEVVRHLMKVASGLDSMVLGEPQILGQIKSAWALSSKLEALGPVLTRTFQDAFSIAKKVRTDTAIGESPVSVAYASVVLAERIFSDLSSLSVLLIGAGNTVELVARHLRDKGVRRVVVANRTMANALEIAARFDGQGVLLSDIPERLGGADIVVSCTGSQLPLLGKGAVERALRQRRHKPMLLIDLAVPRDIEVEVGEAPDAYLYNIDDIGELIEDSHKSRSEAAAQAEAIIERGMRRYLQQLRALDAVATLRAFRRHADAIRARELERALRALERDEPVAAVLESLARAITNKLTHAPSVQMKNASAEGRSELLHLIRELYDLDEASESPP